MGNLLGPVRPSEPHNQHLVDVLVKQSGSARRGGKKAESVCRLVLPRGQRVRITKCYPSVVREALCVLVNPRSPAPGGGGGASIPLSTWDPPQ